VEELVAPGIINTMPLSTLRAFADHGVAEPALRYDSGESHRRVLDDATAAGVDIHGLTTELEREGVEAFCESYRELLDCIESKVERLRGRALATPHG
jgi:transaldolase